MKYTLFTLFIFYHLTISSAKQPNKIDAINSGIAWFDNNGKVVSAHGAGITKDNNRYYLFGEFKSDTSNAFNGFSCYSSTDLYNWKFENMVLAVQDTGILGPNRVGERPKVMRCPSTGEYVMYMHSDDIRYKNQCVGYATCNKIDGNYTFQGPLLYNGKPIKKWDMGVFQDDDGSGYVITHSGNLYKLSNDYKSITKQVVKKMTGRCESPAILKKNGIYFWLGSDLTSWERNDNYYFTATSLNGPWKAHGLFAPKGTLTWNSQSTFVLPIIGRTDTTFMYMGDRWAFPRQNSAATYVWQPLSVSNEELSLPTYQQSWQIDLTTGRWHTSAPKGKEIENNNTKKITYTGNWTHTADIDSRTNETDAGFTITFKGKQIGIFGTNAPDGGYAEVSIENSKGQTIISTTLDMYCKYKETSLKFLSPIMEKGEYKLTFSTIGEHGNWYKKNGTKFGSTGNYVSINKIVIR